MPQPKNSLWLATAILSRSKAEAILKGEANAELAGIGIELAARIKATPIAYDVKPISILSSGEITFIVVGTGTDGLAKVGTKTLTRKAIKPGLSGGAYPTT